MQRIIPCIWFDHTALEAADFYVDAFDDAKMGDVQRYPEREVLPEFQQELAGQPLTVEVSIRGYKIMGINAGPEFRPNPSISFMVNFQPEERERLDELWRQLAEDGRILMALDAYHFSPHYGWVQDRYGVSWQLMLLGEADPERPFIVPSLMFTERVLGRAAAAVSYYTDLFEGRTVLLDRYTEVTGIAAKGAVQFAAFRMLGQEFGAMDAPVEQGFTFSHGLSLIVECRDQKEIDRYWEALSSVPEAEQCGWCVDRFGVSWQVTPADWVDLLTKPGAYEKLLAMKKIEITDFD